MTDTSEAFTACDSCGQTRWWDELSTGDDGETWVCPQCRTDHPVVKAHIHLEAANRSLKLAKSLLAGNRETAEEALKVDSLVVVTAHVQKLLGAIIADRRLT